MHWLRHSSRRSVTLPQPTSVVHSQNSSGKLGYSFNDAHVTFDVAGAQCLERLLVSRSVVAGDGLVEAWKLDQHYAFVHPGFVSLCRIAAREKAAAGAFDRRHCELGIGLPRFRVFYGSIGHHPVRLGHNALPFWLSLKLIAQRPVAARPAHRRRRREDATFGASLSTRPFRA